MCFFSLRVGEEEMSMLCGAVSDPDGHVLVMVYNLSAIITALMKRQLMDHTVTVLMIKINHTNPIGDHYKTTYTII